MTTKVEIAANTAEATRLMRLLRWRVEATAGGPRGRVARFCLDQAEGRAPRPL